MPAEKYPSIFSRQMEFSVCTFVNLHFISFADIDSHGVCFILQQRVVWHEMIQICTPIRVVWETTPNMELAPVHVGQDQPGRYQSHPRA